MGIHLPVSQMSLPKLSVRHLLGIRELTREDLLAIFHVAEQMQGNGHGFEAKRDVLAGKTVVNLFVEDSTRTRNSFQLAETRLGAAVLNVTGGEVLFQRGKLCLIPFR